MSRFLRRIERYNKNHRGYIRKLLSFSEFVLLIVTIPVFIIFSNKVLNLDLTINRTEYFFFAIIVLASWYIKKRLNSQARIPRTQRFLYQVFNYSQTYFIILSIVILSKFIFGLNNIPVVFILIYLSFFFFVTFIYRFFGFRMLQVYRANGYNLHHVLIIADGFSDQIIEKLINQKEWGFKIRGIVTDSKLIQKKYGKKIAVISPENDLEPIMDHKVIDEILYCKYQVDLSEVNEIMRLCNEVGVIFRMQSTVSPIEHDTFQFKTLTESKFLTLADGPSNHFAFLIKTISDYYFSLLAIILLSPLFLFIAVLIKTDSRGPIFFKQERIGLRGRKFILYKFRTMFVGAENTLADLQEKNEADGPVFKIKEDPRITRVGRFLRKTGLDELPQLQNVILGEMSLIGPRPPLESEVKKYERWQLRRLSVKPGITCSWQVSEHRHDVKFSNWMKMDFNYIDSWSPAKDFQLAIKTILAIFSAQGR